MMIFKKKCKEVKKLSQFGPLSILERKRVYIYIYIEKTKGEGFFFRDIKI
jgi:uncharacterized protein YlbG (UPF0298 family)